MKEGGGIGNLSPSVGNPAIHLEAKSRSVPSSSCYSGNPSIRHLPLWKDEPMDKPAPHLTILGSHLKSADSSWHAKFAREAFRRALCNLDPERATENRIGKLLVQWFGHFKRTRFLVAFSGGL